MVIAPHAFFKAIGPFGLRNDHYIRDNATFSLALGAGALVAVRRPSWRAAVLTVTALQFVLHAANHLLDIGKAHPYSAGPTDFVLLVVGAVLLAALARQALRGGR